VSVTAKVRVQSKQENGEGDERQATLVFAADYQDGRNKEWAFYTPALSLSMTVKGAVADQFAEGAAYTLTFERED
jgi:predicted RNA-binding protein with PIN domain